jgi:FkbM family methyltransferase
MRRIIRKLFRSTGFQRRIAPDFFDVMKNHKIDLVLDVGANDGDFGREIRDRGYRGLIISFEPNPGAYTRLKKLTANDDNWFIYPHAIGMECREGRLFVAGNDVLSSFKGLTKFGQNCVTVEQSVNVQIITLEDFLTKNPQFNRNIYLKIDTQGYEREVLLGAEKVLKYITAVQAELSLIHTYADEFDWIEAILWMRERGFEVATAVCNSAFDAQVREFDFVFVRHD